MTNNAPAPADLVEAVKIWFDDQMESQDETTPSSVQRQNGKTWIEGWFDLPAMFTAMQAYMASDGVLDIDREAALYVSCLTEERRGIVSEAFAAHRRAAAITFDRDSACPICHMNEGCSHTVTERQRAAAITPQPGPRDAEDTRLLNALRDECWDLRCFDVPTGGDDADVAWRVVGHWMAKPHERVIAEGFNHDPRVAIRAALAKSEGQ